jgi:multiple sugar transport system permease protein
MSIAVTDRTAPGAEETRTLPGETGMVERPRARWLPFSPWHLLLMPAAILMLIPLVWMIATSLETLAQTRHFPPILWPGEFQWSNYPETLRAAPFARWFWNTTVVTAVVLLSYRCARWPPMRSRIRFLGKQVALPAARDVDSSVPWSDPDLPVVKRMGLHDHLGALIVPAWRTCSASSCTGLPTLPIELEEAADRRRPRLKIPFTTVRRHRCRSRRSR